MGKMIFILGGARSGKSDFASELAKKTKGNVAFLATASASDSEMKQRILKHRNNRPKQWKTVEVKRNLDEVIASEKSKVLLIDCLTIYASGLMKLGPEKIFRHMEKVIQAIKKTKSLVLVVSNEVGCGVVPAYKLGRDYRDVLGKVNQIFVRAADEFYLMFAGYPFKPTKK
jgi:adenosylcobinamide kinase/adenosylcobinamide-phosphate guanylyltransferase